MREYDYIVVGGGTSGCVIASRLTERDDVTVLLVEAGPTDRDRNIHMPAGLFKLLGGKLTWNHTTVPQAHLNNRTLPLVQGRVLGGGSSVNGLVFTRGCPEDYDRWKLQYGCRGWGFADVQPFFLKSELNDTLADDFHGTEGPQGISTMSPDPLTRVFIRACQEAGIPYTPDFNGPRQDGAGAFQTFTWSGRRCSAATAYLSEAKFRPNLEVQTDCIASRILFDGTRAKGLELFKNEVREEVSAAREVLVTAGAIGSPKLLMLSGIGPSDELSPLGIDPVCDLPGVGKNLQDHLDIDVVLSVDPGHGMDKYKASHRMLWAGLQYLAFTSGPATSSIVEGGAFWSVDPFSETPDTQLHFEPASGTEPGSPTSPTGAGCMFNGYFVRPESRGSVKLSSSDAFAPPLIDPNYLAEPKDLEMSVRAVKLMREIARQPAFSSVGGAEIYPGNAAKSDAEIADFVRNTGRTSYHPVGTCRMGPGRDAVVDTSLRVHGLEGLRVCDSSIMPQLISSNTNAAAYMIGEKVSALIAGEEQHRNE